jgi:hypothetical protein
MSRFRPVTARSAPQWWISSRHFAPLPICVKIFHSQCYLVATVIHTQSVRCKTCVCVCACTHTHTHTHARSQYRGADRAKEIKRKMGHQLMPHAKDIFPHAILGTRIRGSWAQRVFPCSFFCRKLSIHFQRCHCCHVPFHQTPSVNCTIPSDKERKSCSATLGTCNCMESRWVYIYNSIYIYIHSPYSLMHKHYKYILIISVYYG